MNNFFYNLFDSFKRRKGYFLFLLILGIVAVVLGVVGAINLTGNTIDLTNISYIKFLQGGSFGSLIFGLIFSLLVFFILMLICHLKKFLLPFGIVFYLYLIYSQTFILLSIILIYGIFNCIILFVLLLIYFIFLWIIFLFLMCELINFVKIPHFFKTCFSLRESKVLIWMLSLIIVSIIFSLILLILQKFVILLIFN